MRLGLEECENAMKCIFSSMALHKLTSNFSRSYLDSVYQLLNVTKEEVVLNPQVILCQNLEPTECAVGHVDMEVHATWSQQCLINLVPPVCREHDDPLIPATRPQSINEVQ